MLKGHLEILHGGSIKIFCIYHNWIGSKAKSFWLLISKICVVILVDKVHVIIKPKIYASKSLYFFEKKVEHEGSWSRKQNAPLKKQNELCTQYFTVDVCLVIKWNIQCVLRAWQTSHYCLICSDVFKTITITKTTISILIRFSLRNLEIRWKKTHLWQTLKFLIILKSWCSVMSMPKIAEMVHWNPCK